MTDSYSDSNAIGSFEIGISPIGSQPAFNVENTIISQYANSPILLQIINCFSQCIDQTENFDAFYDDIWNIYSAQGYGLDVWGRIVGVVRTIQVAATDYLGFKEPNDATETGFGQAAFYSGEAVTGNYSLSDSSFRTLILAKELANISNGSVASLNQLLRTLFPGRGNCYVTDGNNMTMTYTFQFALSSVEIAIIQNSGVLPTPVGVYSTVVISA